MGISSYGKIYAVGHRLTEKLFDGEVVVQEKVDGSQFSFGVIDGKLHCRSKGVAIDLDHPAAGFGLSVQTAKDAFERGVLLEGLEYRGEAMSKPKHNTLAYDRVPKGNIALYDVGTGPGQPMEPVAKLDGYASDIGCEGVPCYYVGQVDNKEGLEGFLSNRSFLGGQIEGIVVKNHTQLDPMDANKTLKAKIVKDSFKEVHHKDWNDRNPNKKDSLTEIVDAFAVPARFEKAIQHLRDEGQLDNAACDIGPLMGELARDLESECEDDIKEALFRSFKKVVIGGVTKRFPSYYKEKLAQGEAA